MKCFHCDNGSLRVVSSRYKNKQFIRRRLCDNCGHRVTTVEIPYETYSGILGFVDSFRSLFKTV